MFHEDRWVKAFIRVCGADVEESFACIKALALAVKTAPGALFGHSAAVKLERIMREACVTVNDKTSSTEFAIRFIVLLVEKNCFKYIDVFLLKIEQWLDEQKGILDLTVESAVPLEGASEEELKKQIMEKTRAKEIKMKINVVPELLGGYRLRMSGAYIDASLKGQLEKMTTELSLAY